MFRFIPLLLVLIAISLPARADFNNAVMFYASGKYEQAFLEMRSLAEGAEHDLAMYYVGVMYARGQGVEQDYEQAAEWLLKAAKKGVPNAQYKLANQYTEGQGLPKDYEYAYAWYATAVAGGHKLSQNAISEAEGNLTEEELTEARKLADKFIQSYLKQETDQQQP